MAYVIERPSGLLEPISGAFQSGDGEEVVNHPPEWLTSSTDEDRAEIGVHLVEAAEVPEDVLVVAIRYERIAGVVTQVLDHEPAPVIVPASVTPRQLRLALLAAGKLGQVTAFIGSGQAPEAAVISWEYATEFLRSDPMLGQFAAMLGLTDDDVDALFIAAARIQ